jgi:hypothetical protein
MPYAVSNLTNNTYTGWRMAQDNLGLKENETFAESLDGLTELAPPPPPKTPQEKLEELTAFMLTQSTATQVSFIVTSTCVKTALEAGSLGLALALVEATPTGGDPDKIALKNAVKAILNG